jgi:radical SAM protein with 4Fe4S-binding SPASM domain
VIFVTDLPYVIAWESTKACKFACLHCRAEAQTRPDPGELTTEEVKDLISQIAGDKRLFIITGGDPLLRDDIFQITEYASNLGLRVALALSGSKVNQESAEKMKKSGVAHISFSMDGSNSEIHDAFRGVAGAYDRTLKNISYIKKAALPFNILTTVTKYNYEDVWKIQVLVENLGASMWDLFMLVEITPQEYEKLMEEFYIRSQKTKIPIKMTCAPQYQRVMKLNKKKLNIASNRHKMIQHGCMAGNGYCFISHKGDVCGCGFLPISAGNIKTNSLEEIYSKSKLFNELRNKDLLKGKCGICEFKVVCGGCRARAYGVHKDHLAEEEYCIYTPTGRILEN